MNTQEKLTAIRLRMKETGVTALYVGTTDPHQTESVAAHWKSLQWLTGFTGSMGYAIVTADDAQFWTDGRYKTQAQREIMPGTFKVNSISDAGTLDWDAWLLTKLKPNDTLALDGDVLSEAMLRLIRAKLPVPGLTIYFERYFVAELWSDRPSIPTDPVWDLAPQYAVESRPEKLQRLRQTLASIGTNAATLLCGLDDIAWLTNLRGNDNPLYPFFHAYALVEQSEAHLCTDLTKLSEDIRIELAADGWCLHDYQAIGDVVAACTANVLYVDPFKTPFKLFNVAQQNPTLTIKEGLDLVTSLKASKTQGEMANIREANIHECVAVVRLMRWIESHVNQTTLDEYTVGQKLEDFRQTSPYYLQPANIPIVGYGPNAALPHYRPSKTMTSPIEPKGFLLFDVCAHYLCGTTDLTRTVAVGDLTAEMKRDYTMTLKAHMTLARQKFPVGTTGNLLDAIVKANHWNHAMNFGHGTGHGIGYLLNVHEGPAKIITEYAPLFPYARETALKPGMLFSNEPGVYKPGRHGIRLENSVFVIEDQKTEFGQFLGFETITFLPFEAKAIVREALTDDEVAWLNHYHKLTYEKLSPLLTPQECAWLKDKTKPID